METSGQSILFADSEGRLHEQEAHSRSPSNLVFDRPSCGPTRIEIVSRDMCARFYAGYSRVDFIAKGGRGSFISSLTDCTSPSQLALGGQRLLGLSKRRTSCLWDTHTGQLLFEAPIANFGAQTCGAADDASMLIIGADCEPATRGASSFSEYELYAQTSHGDYSLVNRVRLPGVHSCTPRFFRDNTHAILGHSGGYTDDGDGLSAWLLPGFDHLRGGVVFRAGGFAIQCVAGPFGTPWVACLLNVSELAIVDTLQYQVVCSTPVAPGSCLLDWSLDGKVLAVAGPTLPFIQLWSVE